MTAAGHEPSKRIVIAGTGTGVGKTHVACALLWAWAERATRAIGLKPVETGVSAGEGGSLSDQERLWAASAAFHVKQPGPTGGFHVKRALYAFSDGVSPHLAARNAGVRIDLGAIRRWIEEKEAPISVIETAGGLFSPLGPGVTNLDLVIALRPSWVLLVAPDRLGVLHDVTTTVGLARARGCPIDATALSASEVADASAGQNALELERLGIVRPVAVFPRADERDARSIEAASKVIGHLH